MFEENYGIEKTPQEITIEKWSAELLEKYAEKIRKDKTEGKLGSDSLDEVFKLEEKNIPSDIHDKIFYAMLKKIHENDSISVLTRKEKTPTEIASEVAKLKQDLLTQAIHEVFLV